MNQSKLDDMIKVLKDAGMYEENMLNEDIENCYKAIADSKDTSQAEDKAREYDNSSPEDMFELVTPNSPNTDNDPDINTNVDNTTPESITTNLFKPRTWSSGKESIDKENVTMETVRNVSEEKCAVQDATKANISFHDMPKINETTLNIIYHPMKYTNIQNSEKFINADTATKAMMLYSHHTALEKMRTQLARQSFYAAPLPKPIILKELLTVSLEMSSDDFDDTYVSRSGRQTKRKIYNDYDEDSIDGSTNKKSKAKNDDETEWLSKTKVSNKTVQRKQEVVQKEEIAQEAMDVDVNESVIPKETPKSKSKKPLTNAEIMSRSSLFADSPKRRTTSTRCELLFDNLKEESQKKQKEEKIMETFKKSLGPETEISQINSQKDEDIITILEEQPVRVVPRIPLRRNPIHNKSKQQKTNKPAPLNISTERVSSSIQKTNSESSEELFEVYVKQKPSKSVSKENGVVIPSSEAGSSMVITCPICSKVFPEDAIVTHASSCGEEQIVTRYVSKQKLTCELCDRVITTNYEVHVRECRIRQEELDKKRK